MLNWRAGNFGLVAWAVLGLIPTALFALAIVVVDTDVPAIVAGTAILFAASRLFLSCTISALFVRWVLIKLPRGGVVAAVEGSMVALVSFLSWPFTWIVQVAILNMQLSGREHELELFEFVFLIGELESHLNWYSVFVALCTWIFISRTGPRATRGWRINVVHIFFGLLAILTLAASLIDVQSTIGSYSAA